MGFRYSVTPVPAGGFALGAISGAPEVQFQLRVLGATFQLAVQVGSLYSWDPRDHLAPDAAVH